MCAGRGHEAVTMCFYHLRLGQVGLSLPSADREAFYGWNLELGSHMTLFLRTEFLNCTTIHNYVTNVTVWATGICKREVWIWDPLLWGFYFPRGLRSFFDWYSFWSVCSFHGPLLIFQTGPVVVGLVAPFHVCGWTQQLIRTKCPFLGKQSMDLFMKMSWFSPEAFSSSEAEHLCSAGQGGLHPM